MWRIRRAFLRVSVPLRAPCALTKRLSARSYTVGKRKLKARAFNPEKFRNDVAMLPASDAADVAVNWRTQFNTAMNASRRVTEQVLEVAVLGSVAAVSGYVDGRLEAKKKKIIDRYVAEGKVPADADANTYPFVEGDESDPTSFIGIPYSLWATVGFGGLALFGLGGPYNYLLRTAAGATMATWSSSLGRDIGYDAGMKAPDEETA